MLKLFIAIALTSAFGMTAFGKDSRSKRSSEVSPAKVEVSFDEHKELLTLRYRLVASNGCGAKIVRYQVKPSQFGELGQIEFDTESAAKSGQMCSMALRPVTLTVKVRDFRASSLLTVNGQDLGVISLGDDGRSVSFETNHVIEKL